MSKPWAGGPWELIETPSKTMDVVSQLFQSKQSHERHIITPYVLYNGIPI